MILLQFINYFRKLHIIVKRSLYIFRIFRVEHENALVKRERLK